MFKKRLVVFEVNKSEICNIIDQLSKYGNGITVKTGILANDDIYHVSLKCKPKDYQDCMDKILELVRNDSTIKRLGTF